MLYFIVPSFCKLRRFNLILLALGLLNIAPTPSVFAAAKNKKAACARLVEASAEQNQPPLFEKVDWQSYRNNLRAMGYPDHIIDKKIAKLKHEFNPKKKLKWLNKAWTGFENDRKIRWDHSFTTADYKILAEHHGADFTKELGFWDQLPGFNTAQFVRVVITSDWNSARYHLLEKHLAYWAHLWLKSPGAVDSLTLYFRKTTNLIDASWTRNYLEPKQKSQFYSFLRNYLITDTQRAIRRNDNNDDEYLSNLLIIMALLPPSQIPADIRRELSRWTSTEEYKPMQSSHIETCAHGNYQTGSCSDMASGHLNALGIYDMPKRKKRLRKAVLIKVDGQIVGAMKMVGDPSMVALKNVITPDNRQVLAIGGVYHLPKDIVSKARRSASRNPRWWQVFEVNTLLVTPSVFLLNDANLGEDYYFPFLLKSVQNNFSKDELIDFMHAMNEGDLANKIFSPEDQQRIWDELLRLLDEKREQIESGRTTRIE